MIIHLLFLFSGCTRETKGNDQAVEKQQVLTNREDYSIIFTKQKDRTDNIYQVTREGKTRQ
ncbi:MAG: hypothetical protein KDB79_09990, partial [Acidobacteria bacterium]|nr:hypothetical protein [Acidobacteriota bacterium]